MTLANDVSRLFALADMSSPCFLPNPYNSPTAGANWGAVKQPGAEGAEPGWTQIHGGYHADVEQAMLGANPRQELFILKKTCCTLPWSPQRKVSAYPNRGVCTSEDKGGECSSFRRK